MRERPILFSAPMVRALLAGTKTQTRRLVNPQPPSPEAVRARAGIDFHPFNDGRCHDKHGRALWRVAGPVWAVRELMNLDATSDPKWRCPYGVAGDRLWVKETWGRCDRGQVIYRADDIEALARERQWVSWPTWKPSIHMSRWASRITLEIADVRCERLNAITEEDAKAEGVDPIVTTRKVYPSKHAADVEHASYREAFEQLWDKINGKRAPWDSNPWVWIVSFKRISHYAKTEAA